MQGLTQVGQFSVAPMPSAEALSAGSKGKDKLRALAEATKAGKIVHGDYYIQGETIQFHAWVQDMVAKKNILAFEPAAGRSRTRPRRSNPCASSSWAGWPASSIRC